MMVKRVTRILSLMLIIGLMFIVCGAPALAKRRHVNKKKKVVTQQQKQMRLPLKPEDQERQKHINRWIYYHGYLEKDFGNNFSKDKAFIIKARRELESFLKTYTHQQETLTQWLGIYDDVASQLDRRRMSLSQQQRVRDTLREHHQQLIQHYREFRVKKLY